jgi:hypothetical protein
LDNDPDLAAGHALIGGAHPPIGADNADDLYLVDADAIRRPPRKAPRPFR